MIVDDIVQKRNVNTPGGKICHYHHIHFPKHSEDIDRVIIKNNQLYFDANFAVLIFLAAGSSWL